MSFSSVLGKHRDRDRPKLRLMMADALAGHIPGKPADTQRHRRRARKLGRVISLINGSRQKHDSTHHGKQ